jgi:hypothetical protein
VCVWQRNMDARKRRQGNGVSGLPM